MKTPSSNTGKKRGKRTELAAWLKQRHPPAIGEAEWTELQRELTPVSDGYLRKLLWDSGVPLSPLVEGVRQSTFDELETTLGALLQEYESADAARRASIRRLVIAAKDHARWASHNHPEKHPEKEEMILWMVTWLENPPLFREWVKLRRRVSAE